MKKYIISYCVEVEAENKKEAIKEAAAYAKLFNINFEYFEVKRKNKLL